MDGTSTRLYEIRALDQIQITVHEFGHEIRRMQLQIGRSRAGAG